jgi:transcriptional regulator with XRE-family HTH domain
VAQDELKELGRRIRQRRKSLGWSQEQFALEAEIDRSYVGSVERGQRNLTFTVLCRLCAALQCDVASLTFGLPAEPS